MTRPHSVPHTPDPVHENAYQKNSDADVHRNEDGSGQGAAMLDALQIDAVTFQEVQEIDGPQDMRQGELQPIPKLGPVLDIIVVRPATHEKLIVQQAEQVDLRDNEQHRNAFLLEKPPRRCPEVEAH